MATLLMSAPRDQGGKHPLNPSLSGSDPIRTLAHVRKLAVPTLEVNIARNQVNVAEAKT